MPAQVAIMADQLETIYRESGGHDVVVCESPMESVLEIWVLDEESQATDTHRTLLLDVEGNPLSDHRAHDTE